MKKIFLGIILLVVIAGAGLLTLRFFSGDEDAWLCVDGSWVKHGQPSSPMPTSGCGDAGLTARQTDFIQTGNLVKDNPGAKKGVWYLVYEKPGKPALTAELVFDSQSKCTAGIVGGVENGPCDMSWVENGYRATVKGLDENDRIWVNSALIEPAAAAKKTIELFYYNQIQDEGLGGGEQTCNPDAILPVEREVEVTGTPIQDAINLLMQGLLTAKEKSDGFTTEFPNKNFKLLGANLADGILTLEFTEVPGFTSGGSCRVGLLANQIIKTAKQFEGVREVRFKPEELFQP
jgi:hypothetical protein